MTRALIVGRKRKGRHIGSAVRRVQTALEAEGWQVSSAIVKRRSALRRHSTRAVRAGWDVAVAVGGDGAVHEVVSAVAGSRTALGIIPMGTGNLLAGNLHVPSAIDGAIRAIVAMSTKRIDVGVATVGGQRYVFAVACGIGFDADVMDRTPSRTKRKWGKAAYFASAVSVSRDIRSEPVEIKIDGVNRTMNASEVMIANFGRMMAGVSPRDPVRPDDGWLDVIVLDASGPIEAFAASVGALVQSKRGKAAGGHVLRTRGHHIRVKAKRSRRVEVDGSVVGVTPVRVTIRPKALTVIVPAD